MLPVPAKVFEQSMHSAALELKYERSSHLVDIISKDEDLRRLRFDINILEDDNDELRGLLTQETQRSDAFEKLVNDNLSRAETAESQLYSLSTELMQKDQTLSRLTVEREVLERQSKQGVSAAVADKLHLEQQLADARIELEHRKAQAAETDTLKTEKNELQRQLSDRQLELENARREAKRALAKRRNTGVEIAQEEQVDDLRRQLAKEKRARQRLEEAADMTQSDAGVDEVRKELAREKRARAKAEEKLEEAQNATQVEDVRRDLLKEKKGKQKLEDEIDRLRSELETQKKAAARATKKAEGNAGVDEQLHEIQEDLAKEQKERLRVEKEAKKAEAEFAAQKEVLEEKLNQFRTKLRSTKDSLKAAEAELAEVKEAQARAVAEDKTTRTKASKKRPASEIDVDATTLGTPGDGPAAKRGRKVAGMGDKSTFSITPFLNKTMSVMAESDGEKAEESPAPRKQPLAEQPPSKTNVQKKAKAPRKPKTKPGLEIVAEEAEDVHSQGQENADAAKERAVETVQTKSGDTPQKPAAKSRAKLRKSISDFATFTAEPAVKKKRKLGGAGKTLFDQDDEDGPPAKALPSKGLFGSKAFGLGAKRGGLLSSLKPSAALMTAADGSGFQFSPLKRNRRTNLDDTLRG